MALLLLRQAAEALPGPEQVTPEPPLLREVHRKGEPLMEVGACAYCGRLDGGRCGDLCWTCKDDLEPIRKQAFAMGFRPQPNALAEIVSLLRSIDNRLKSVIEGDMTVDVTVKNSVYVKTDYDEPIQTWSRD